MKRQPTWIRFGRKLGAILFLNIAMAIVLIAYFFPHWLPFMQKEVRPALAVPVSAAPAPEDSKDPAKPVIIGKPVRVKVPDAGINIQVMDGVYNEKNHTWSLSNDKAHYALMTPRANNIEGNTFIYGHNRRSVFAPLLKIQPGAEAIVETDNGKTFHYVLRSATDVDPSDVSIFTYKGAPILTLQTCSGTWYEDRRLFIFDFVKVENLT
ncbi:MAG TPA: sortase [Candidatus Saccharimonadales bacterium]|nr:sortase [Candidatus Saccharimonadales bacterium]